MLHEKATWQPDVATTADGGRHWQVQTGTSLYLGSFTWNYTPGQPGYQARAISAAAGPDLGVYDLSCPSAATAGSPPRTARWLSYKQPTAVRIGLGNR